MAQLYKRRILREKVLQILYAYELNREGLKVLIEGVIADINSEKEKEFARNLVYRVLGHEDELDAKIMERVDNWEMSRIATIDKILLRMGICELMYFPDIPPKVSINESIEIAKNFSTAGSGKFINGILDAILIELKEKGTLIKLGRGLLDESFSKQNEDDE
jgi:transcription antitermination protein NusB